ncbi:hypothetical protein B0H63DRAFT_530143 [Podospora didyma]|uniref:Uncharacterized protein n=1 Tax=Podospora didyma TaxID=330526 RepID=A0AAE0P3L8_9PEZI|nr:hypothetical protein B0H63DRAFT_530143 [Podospora didyma]
MARDRWQFYEFPKTVDDGAEPGGAPSPHRRTRMSGETHLTVPELVVQGGQGDKKPTEENPRIIVDGGKAEGGDADARAYATGNTQQQQQQLIFQGFSAVFPEKARVDELQEQIRQQGITIQDLTEQLEKANNYVEEQKARFEEVKKRLDAREEEFKKHQSAWQEARDLEPEIKQLRQSEEDARQAWENARQQTTQKENEKYIADIRAYQTELKMEKEARGAEAAQYKVVEAERSRLEDRVSELRAQLGSNFDSVRVQKPAEKSDEEMKLEEMITKAQEKWDSAKTTVASCTKVVSVEEENAINHKKMGVEYDGPLEKRKKAMYDAQENAANLGKEVERLVDRLKIQRSERFGSTDSASTAPDSLMTITSRDSVFTADTEWTSFSCDQCGKTTKLLFPGLRSVRSTRTSISDSRKSG